MFMLTFAQADAGGRIFM